MKQLNAKPVQEFKYEIFAIIKHAGNSSNYGHYISEIWDGNNWIQFDDDRVVYNLINFLN